MMIYVPDTLLYCGRMSIALVWLYQGLWCKVLGKTPRHARVVEASPLFTPAAAHIFLLALGCVEVLLAIWMVSGVYLTAAALVQTVLLVAMNAGGLLWAHDIIPDPAGMIFHNLALVVLIWICR